MEGKEKRSTKKSNHRPEAWWRKSIELPLLILYADAFYFFVIHRSLHISRDHYAKLYDLRLGWLFPPSFNDASDAQWRNFRGNLCTMTIVFLMYAVVANVLRSFFVLRAKGMAIVWLFISFTYLPYLHQACVVFILAIASFF